MINTSELRIGNIILFNGEPIAVKGIHTNSVLLDGVMRPSVNGIDFEYNLYHHRSSSYTIRKDDEGYYIGMYKNDGPIHITPNHFHSYHQLQNVYFAQYGEEFGVSEHDVKIAWRIVKAFNRQ